MSRLLSVTPSQADALRRLVMERTRAPSKSAQPDRSAPIEFLVDTAAPLSGTDNRWRYVLKESRVDPTTMLPALVDGGLEVEALNREEDGNTDEVVAGGLLVADFLPDWEVFPVSYGPGGVRCHKSVVAEFGFYDGDGVAIWRFSSPNVIDGPCPPPASESG